MRRLVAWASFAVISLVAALVLVVRAQPQPGSIVGPVPPGAAAGHDHATPAGWKFVWPGGDPVRGRDVFVKLECYSCHEVRGQQFPVPSDVANVGPELSVMGPLHPPEYFAESVVNPGAVVEKGKGYEAPDGSSRMPSYNDSVTVQEAIDLVAFLASLRPPHAAPGDHGGASGSKPH
jgi:hypothetical protein